METYTVWVEILGDLCSLFVPSVGGGMLFPAPPTSKTQQSTHLYVCVCERLGKYI